MGENETTVSRPWHRIRAWELKGWSWRSTNSSHQSALQGKADSDFDIERDGPISTPEPALIEISADLGQVSLTDDAQIQGHPVRNPILPVRPNGEKCQIICSRHEKAEEASANNIGLPKFSWEQTIDEAKEVDKRQSLPQGSSALPQAWGSARLRTLRWRIGSAYRRLYLLVIVINVVFIALFCTSRFRGGLEIQDDNSRRQIGSNLQTAFAVNIFAAVLLRQEHVVNLLYRIFVTNISWKMPLWARRRFAKVYCMGGIHSGCALSACLWHILATIVGISNLSKAKDVERFLTLQAVLVWLVLMIIVMCSAPAIRNKHHNLFELTHRFGGWTLVVLLWLHITVFAQLGDRSYKANLARLPAAWLLAATTALIIYPWLRLKHIPVRAEKMSSHAVRLFFGSKISPCRVIRMSHSPLIESHAFATIPQCDKSGGSSVIISKAGDWTKAAIEQPPSKIWIRDISTWGVIRIATMFKSVVVVTTGSGIGPCLSLFLGHPNLPCRILWSTKNPERTYGTEVVNDVRKADPKALIIDTSTRGRFDMVKLSYDLYVSSKAEAVIVISNPTLTGKIVFELESRGIPAYGPIWDS